MLLAIMLSGCGDSSTADKAAQTVSSAGPERLSEAQMQQWLRSCALCHVTGVGGAPLVGNVEQWQERVEQGRELLLAHTIEGFNAMPPLGYCMSCEREDFSAMIDFMAGDAQ
jgi:cytochrome c5